MPDDDACLRRKLVNKEMKNFIFIFYFIFRFIKNSIYCSNLINCIRLKYGECALKRFRNIERLTIKLAKAQCDNEFLRMCLIYGLTPKFIKFKLANRHLASSPRVKKFQRELLLIEYTEK
jgi:hypothetical protein